MSEELRQFVREAVMVVFGGMATFFITHFRRPQQTRDEHMGNQAKIIESQGKLIADVYKMVEDLQQSREDDEKRIAGLQSEVWQLKKDLRKYVNAYAQALRFIHENIPNVILPDFLMDTKDLGIK